MYLPVLSYIALGVLLQDNNHDVLGAICYLNAMFNLVCRMNRA